MARREEEEVVVVAVRDDGVVVLRRVRSAGRRRDDVWSFELAFWVSLEESIISTDPSEYGGRGW